MSFRTIPKMKFYCSKCQHFLAFNTFYDILFWVFGVPNAKYLAFGILDRNALRVAAPLFIYIYKFKKKIT